MRLATFLSTALAASAVAFTAHASPLGPVATINVAVGPDLQAKADDYGARDLDYLAADLRTSVERALGRDGALAASGGTLDLVIEDAVPNRPTMRQLVKTAGLSYESFGIGGATVSGVLTSADGRQTPVSYRWYETDIRWSRTASTWTDAENTFDRFARRLVTGEAANDR